MELNPVNVMRFGKKNNWCYHYITINHQIVQDRKGWALDPADKKDPVSKDSEAHIACEEGI